MATAAQLLDAARADLGYHESPPGSNRTKFAALAGHANGEPWCATWVVAKARQVGLHLPSESAYTPAMAAAFIAARMTTTTPQPGDIVFFDFPDGETGIQHVGIVESASAMNETSLEGNTSSGIAGSQDNGGVVARRTRPRRYCVLFGRPSYDQAPVPAPRPEDTMTDAERIEIAAAVATAMQPVIDKLSRQIDALTAPINELRRNLRTDVTLDGGIPETGPAK